MSRPHLASGLTTILLLGVHSGAAAQDPTFPPVDAPIEGVVLDEDLDPVAGARVRLVASTDPTLVFGRSIAQALRRTPLPETVSHDDGSFVLALTTSQRHMHVVEHPRFQPERNQFWLVVEKDDYLPWREPIECGLANYLGSRVILRAERDGDPFAQVPWPPADPRMTYPWVGLSELPSDIAATRRGVAPEVAVDDVEYVRSRLRIVTDDGRPVAEAHLRLSNSCYGPSTERELPTEADENGDLELEAPPGQHRIAVLASGFMPHFADWTAAAQSEATPVEFVLQRADVVDLLAVDHDGRPVPFVEVDVVAFNHDRMDRPSLSRTTDSLGRIRMRVPARADYFAYSDEGVPSRRVAFEDHEIVRVVKLRPVTVVMRADELPSHGLIRRLEPDGEVFQSYTAGPRSPGPDTRSESIATRTFARGFEAVWIGGRGKPPIVIRSDDLPPPAAEPVLDLAFLDRRIRKRAGIDLRVDGRRPNGFRISPLWQPDVRDPFQAIRFSKRGPAPDRAWQFWARDDRAYQAIATAKGCDRMAIEVPARDPDGTIPTVVVELTRN